MLAVAIMKPIIKPDLIIASIGISLIFALAGDLTLYAVLPVVAVTEGIHLANIGLLLSANRFVRFISNPVVGYLLNSRRRKIFLVGGLLLGATTTLLYQYYDNFWIFLTGRILWGVAFSLSYITAYSMVMDITESHQRGHGSGLLQTYYLIGLAVTPFLGALLNNWFGFQITMLICSILGYFGALEAWIFVPETLPKVIPIDETQQQDLPLQINMPFDLLGVIKGLGKFDIVSGNLIYGLTFFVGEGILLSTITYYFLYEYGSIVDLGLILIPAATAGGIILGLRAAASAFFAPLVGKASDNSSNRWAIIALGALAGIIGLIIIINIKSPFIFILGTIIFAINGAVIQSVIPAILIDSQKNGRASFVLGMMATSADIGLALAPMVSYAILENYPISTLYYGGVFILAVSLFFAVNASIRKALRNKVNFSSQ
jgi:MFS family permease